MQIDSMHYHIQVTYGPVLKIGNISLKNLINNLLGFVIFFHNH